MNKQICQQVLNSSFLMHLDISHNQLLLSDLDKLLQILTQDQSLQYLNVSMNQLHSGKDGSCDGLDKYATANLCKFLKRSRHVLHVDVSHCGLVAE